MTKHNILTAAKINALSGPQRVCDGNGLWIQVSTWQTKSWIFAYKFGGNRHMGLGGYPAVSIKTARRLRDDMRELLLRGTDPIEWRKAKRAQVLLDRATRRTFEDDAREYIEAHRPAWTNSKHIQQWETSLATYAYPALGKFSTQDIDGALITQALAPIWKTKTETAKRVRGRIRLVQKWVEEGKPLPQQAAPVKHHEALPFEEVPAFMAALRNVETIPARALEILILTGLRTGEVFKAEWSEFNLEAATWTVPAARMKKRKEHIVPLSTRVLDILNALPRVGRYVFPGTKESHHIGQNAMMHLLRRLRADGVTVHGFRSSFYDWAADRTSATKQTIDFCLAHKIPDKVTEAYRRYTALPKRRVLMEEWSKHCSSPPTIATVTPLRRAK